MAQVPIGAKGRGMNILRDGEDAVREALRKMNDYAPEKDGSAGSATSLEVVAETLRNTGSGGVIYGQAGYRRYQVDETGELWLVGYKSPESVALAESLGFKINRTGMR
jgi:hypothetical protein